MHMSNIGERTAQAVGRIALFSDFEVIAQSCQGENECEKYL